MENEYICKICHLHYKEKELSEECYFWCSKHNSCNLSIARHSIEANKYKYKNAKK